MFFTIRVIHHDELKKEYLVGEVIENSLGDAYQLCLEQFRKNEKCEVYIYKIKYNENLNVERVAILDFRPIYLY